jgi:hypothetical protein
MQKLGVANAAQRPDPEAFDKFQAIFAAPLSACKHEALQTLCSDHVDPVVMKFDFTGLEHDAH